MTYPYSFQDVYHEWTLDFVKGFFGVSSDDHVISVFETIYIRYDIYPFVYSEPFQHLRNKTNLFIVNDVWGFWGG